MKISKKKTSQLLKIISELKLDRLNAVDDLKDDSQDFFETKEALAKIDGKTEGFLLALKTLELY